MDCSTLVTGMKWQLIKLCKNTMLMKSSTTFSGSVVTVEVKHC